MKYVKYGLLNFYKLEQYKHIIKSNNVAYVYDLINTPGVL